MVRSPARQKFQGGRGTTVSASGRFPASRVRLPAMRANAWLVVANVRYWRTVAPLARAELRAWERRAHAIAREEEREVALEKLRRESFNGEVAATLAVFAPVSKRADVVRTIVALEVLYDYLDGLAALPSLDALRDGEEIFRPFVAAFAEPDDEAAAAGGDDGQEPSYAIELARAVQRGLAHLPASRALLPAMRSAARRTAEGRIRSHATRDHGEAQLEAWATRAAVGSGLEWPEFAAGAAASVLAVHALIAAAADERSTAADGADIEGAYLTISAVSTMLDSANDYERDMSTRRPIAIDWYGEVDIPASIASLARRSLAHTASIRDGARHTMIASGVIAYYTSPPEASSARVRPIVKQIHRELRVLVWPALAIMRCWRLAKRLRGAVGTDEASRREQPRGARPRTASVLSSAVARGERIS
jgi:tetraprenyl-beta-curcumene synthase